MFAALALAPAPGGFTVAEHAARVRQITGHDGYTTRQDAYDLRKLRGKQLVDKPGLDPHRFRRHHPKWHDGLRGENRKWDRLARSTPRNIRMRLWSW